MCVERKPSVSPKCRVATCPHPCEWKRLGKWTVHCYGHLRTNAVLSKERCDNHRRNGLCSHCPMLKVQGRTRCRGCLADHHANVRRHAMKVKSIMQNGGRPLTGEPVPSFEELRSSMYVD